MSGERVILAGGSGFIGGALADRLRERGMDVVVLSRRPGGGDVRHEVWDGRSVGAWAGLLDGAAGVVNLAGRSVNCRWTARNREEILASRLDSAEALAGAIARCDRPPRVWVQAGAVGIYGDTGERVLEEGGSAGSGFLAETCARWEEAFSRAAAVSTGKVLLRIGVVLGRDGGLLPVLARLARLGLGGAAGSGRQFISWVHMSDLVSIVEWALEREGATGVYNAVAPAPVRNGEFMRELRHAVHRPWSPPVPALALRAGAMLMRTEPSLALEGQRVEPRRLREAGFAWRFETVGAALRELLARPGRSPCPGAG